MGEDFKFPDPVCYFLLSPDRLRQVLTRMGTRARHRQQAQSWWSKCRHGRPGTALGRVELTIPTQSCLLPSDATSPATGVGKPKTRGTVQLAVLELETDTDDRVTAICGIVTKVNPHHGLALADRRTARFEWSCGYRLILDPGLISATKHSWQPRSDIASGEMCELARSLR